MAVKNRQPRMSSAERRGRQHDATSRALSTTPPTAARLPEWDRVATSSHRSINQRFRFATTLCDAIRGTAVARPFAQLRGILVHGESWTVGAQSRQHAFGSPNTIWNNQNETTRQCRCRTSNLQPLGPGSSPLGCAEGRDGRLQPPAVQCRYGGTGRAAPHADIQAHVEKARGT